MRTIILLLLFATGCNSRKGSVDIVSKVDTCQIDINRIPSYADPRQYHISFTNGRYVVKLPYETVLDDYATIEAAQEKINDFARESLKRYKAIGDY